MSSFKTCTAALSLALMATITAWAQPSQRLSANDVFALRTVTDPQISPDGKRIVYVVNFADIQTDSRFSNLWMINFDGTDNRPITTGNVKDASPRWAPDGSRIAFVSDRGGSSQIWQRWSDSGQMARMTSVPEAPGAIEWS